MNVFLSIMDIVLAYGCFDNCYALRLRCGIGG